MRPSDYEARRAALNPERSFIVQAPAGSGKTEILIQRFLTLLSRVERPHAVVAITFTRKAAGEMKERVLKSLQIARTQRRPEREHEALTYDLAKAVVQRDAELGWDLEHNPSRLQIHTVDAFCSWITGRMPVTSGFGARPEVREVATSLYRSAARRTIAIAESDGSDGDAVRCLLNHLDNQWDKAAQLIEDLLPERSRWLRFVTAASEMDPGQLRGSLEFELRSLVASELEAARQSMPESDGKLIVSLARFAAANLGRSDILDSLASYPRAEASDLAQWQAIADLLLTGAGERRRAVNVKNGFPADAKLQKRQLEDVLQRLPDAAVVALHQVQRLPPPHYSDDQWAILQALVRVLPIAVEQLTNVFRERNEVDFPAITHATLNALGSPELPSDLAYSLDGRIEHLLVDEFQDTSIDQWHLLERLTSEWQPDDGRTLFCVGDPMQSIFRWRDAEVSLFLRAQQQGVSHVRLESLTLAANFRSDAGLVEWTNQSFGQIFPPESDLDLGAIPLAPSTPTREQPGEPAVVVHPVLRSAGQPHADAEEAEVVKRIIDEARASDPDARIAVLFRARTGSKAIAEYLRERRVVFQAVEMDMLSESALIQDLLSLTRALVQPADRIAWLAVLRAPWCGLTLADLTCIGGSQERNTIWEIICSGQTQLSPDGDERVARLRSVLSPAMERRGRLPLRVWVETTWAALGGPACLQSEADLADVEAFWDLLDEFESAGDISDLQALEARIETLFSKPDANASGKLQLLTLHKAKGLEFDVVILPQLHRGRARDDEKLLSWFRRNDTLLLCPMRPTGIDDDPLSKYIGRLNRDASTYEEQRLLYVAATRPRRKLHLVGQVGEKNGDLVKPSSDSQLGMLWPMVEPWFQAALQNRELTASTDEQATAVRLLRRVPLSWNVPQPAARVAVALQRSHSLSPPDPGEVRIWSGIASTAVGTVVHQALEKLTQEDLSRWSEAQVNALVPRWRMQLQQLGLSAIHLSDAADQVAQAVSRTLADPRGRWILSDHVQARNEFAIAGLVDGTVQHLRVDRTFIDEHGTRWIIDYKTSEPNENEDVEAFVDSERDRYRSQVERYGALLRELDPAHEVRFGLYFPPVSAWREWLAVAPAASTAAS